MHYKKIAIPQGRRFATTDIHGCYQSFLALLAQLKLTKNDQLFILGDYINRGPDSKKVIDHIWKMQEKGLSIFCLKGNHEERVVEGYDSYHKKGLFYKKAGWKFLQSFEIENFGELPEKYVEWMRNLPLAFETEGYILVHAGLDFKTNRPFEQTKAMNWIRYWYNTIDYKWLGNRIILHGHVRNYRWEIEENFQLMEQLKVLDIDGGCVLSKPGMGYLCAFDLNEKRLIFQECLDEQI